MGGYTVSAQNLLNAITLRDEELQNTVQNIRQVRMEGDITTETGSITKVRFRVVAAEVNRA